MSRLRLNHLAVSPSAPAAGKLELFGLTSDKKLRTIDDAGLVRTMLEEAAALYRLIKVTEVFQGTVSYTPTTGADALFVECIGAGGQGGGVGTAATNSGAAGGGGGGAYSALWTTTIKAFTVAVGAGGSGAAAGANNGNVGGDTTFDSPAICTAKGGLGGLADTVALGPRIGGLGGTGGPTGTGVGDIKSDGNDGVGGIALAAAQALSGNGGAGFFGGAGRGIKTQGSGDAGGLYGGGGGGGCILSGGASVAGGIGGNGIIRVWEFQAIT